MSVYVSPDEVLSAGLLAVFDSCWSGVSMGERQTCLKAETGWDPAVWCHQTTDPPGVCGERHICRVVYFSASGRNGIFAKTLPETH